MNRGNFSALKQRLLGLLWDTDIQALSKGKAALLRAARIAVAVGRDFAAGQLSLRATSLVYTTLLSLVPLLALAFSMFKAFGVHNQLEPALISLLEPLGEKGVEVARQLVQFVENIGVGVLGAVGLAVLIYTVVSTIQKIEGAFNFIWRVSTLRPLLQRISGYLSVVLLGPLLVFVAMSVMATVMSHSLVKELLTVAPLGGLYVVFSKLLPWLLVSGAFTATYLIIPNTRVRVPSALVGGAVAGLLWQVASWGFTAFVISSTQYTAIYSSFAIVILFLIWLYISWQVLLLGASIAFYYQNPVAVHPASRVLGPRSREALAVEIMRRVGLAHLGETPLCTQQGIATALQLPPEQMADIVDQLIRHGLLLGSDEDPPHLVPARDLGAMTLKDIVDAVSGGIVVPGIAPQTQAVMRSLDASLEQELGGRTLRDLLES
ncbi:MAG TPA: YihY family inner membrane protein [Gammaproteobacteria bacterium]|nr:YihY family inner membrane protein [Gammaproteobacteria bacterium]